MRGAIETTLSGTGRWRFVAGQLFAVCMLLACTWTCLFVMEVSGFEGNWYRIDKVMEFDVLAPFVHRILFVLPALGMQWLLPQLDEMQCYMLSQIVALTLALAAMRRWAGLFVGYRWAVMGPVLMVLMLAPTIRYHTFYDFGIVFFFAAGLYALFMERYTLYLVVLTVGTINHEIVLLLVAVFLALNFDRMPRGRLIALLAAQLLLHAAVRALLLVTITGQEWHPLWLTHNLGILLNPGTGLIRRALFLVFWYMLGALGLLFASRRLRRASLLVPLVLGTTLVFGQFHELRQFNALIPVIVALILTYLARELRIDSTGQGDSLRLEALQVLAAVSVSGFLYMMVS